VLGGLAADVWKKSERKIRKELYADESYGK
jgi:hypothetical protein